MIALRMFAAAVLVALGLSLAAPASAQSYTGGNVPAVGANDAGPVVVIPVVVTPEGAEGGGAGISTGAVPAQGSASERLALTGSDVAGLAAIGIVLVALGAGAVRSSRRLSPA